MGKCSTGLHMMVLVDTGPATPSFLKWYPDQIISTKTFAFQ